MEPGKWGVTSHFDGALALEMIMRSASSYVVSPSLSDASRSKSCSRLKATAAHPQARSSTLSGCTSSRLPSSSVAAHGIPVAGYPLGGAALASEHPRRRDRQACMYFFKSWACICAAASYCMSGMVRTRQSSRTRRWSGSLTLQWQVGPAWILGSSWVRRCGQGLGGQGRRDSSMHGNEPRSGKLHLAASNASASLGGGLLSEAGLAGQVNGQ